MFTSTIVRLHKQLSNLLIQLSSPNVPFQCRTIYVFIGEFNFLNTYYLLRLLACYPMFCSVKKSWYYYCLINSIVVECDSSQLCSSSLLHTWKLPFVELNLCCNFLSIKTQLMQYKVLKKYQLGNFLNRVLWIRIGGYCAVQGQATSQLSLP